MPRNLGRRKEIQKKTWNLLKGALRLNKKTSESVIPKSFVSNGETIDGNKIADGFNKFFSTIGQEIAKNIPKAKVDSRAFLKGSINHKFKFQEICKESIEYYALKIKDKTSVGFDGVSSRVVKRITPAILEPLCHLFNLSLKTGFIPLEFKISRVIPLFKSGRKDDFGNYRPISLIPAFAKLFEHIVNDQIRKYFNCYNLFSSAQFGFRKGSSPTFAVAKFMDEIFKKQQEISLGIFIDIKKAFDSVDHKILLQKLEFYGFSGAELQLMTNYLINRYQYTDIDGLVSDFAEILAGVPQGSVLGPLLFLIYINDFPTSNDFKSFLFADDTSLFLSGTSIDNLKIKAQKELDRVEAWFNANRMQLNSKKTKFILFNLTKAKRSEPFTIKLGEDNLCRVSEESDEKFVRLVGVLLDEELSFKHHIAHIKSKLCSLNFVMARSRNVLPPYIRMLIYNALVKSVLEFACILYGSAKKSTLDCLEKIQKKIIRNVKGTRSRAHTNNIFLELGVLKLKDLIEYNQIVLGHGIWHETLPDNIRSNLDKLENIDRGTRASLKLNFKIPFCKKRMFETAPCFSVPTAWNKLDTSLKSETRLNAFKTKVRNFYFDQYRSEPECNRVGCYSCSKTVAGSS